MVLRNEKKSVYICLSVKNMKKMYKYRRRLWTRNPGINQDIPWVKSELQPMIQQPLVQAIPLKQPTIKLKFENAVESEDYT